MIAVPGPDSNGDLLPPSASSQIDFIVGACVIGEGEEEVFHMDLIRNKGVTVCIVGAHAAKERKKERKKERTLNK